MTRIELVEAARSAARDAWGAAPAAVGVAPGRVELLGNHTDYNEGFVLTAAVDYATAVAIRPRADHTVRARSLHPGYPDVAFDLDAMARTTDDTRWANYVKGVVDAMVAAGFPIGGCDLTVVSGVPDGSGVSSSAALLVGVATALRAVFPGPDLDPMALAQLCRRAENGPFVGAPVGLLDQFSSSCGKAGHALRLDCRTLDWSAVPLPEDRCRILIANTNVKHELADGGGYASRRAACFEAARIVTGDPGASLRDVSSEALDAARDRMAPEVYRRARHVLDENARVLAGADALEAGDFAGFGARMFATHDSCRRLFENSCDEVDLLVEVAADAGAIGAKLTGGGWGGSAVVVHGPDDGPEIAARLTDAYRSRFGVAPSLFPTAAAGGAEAFVP